MACNQIKVLSAKLKANTPETTITLFVSIDNITVTSLRKEALLYFRKHTTYSNKGWLHHPWPHSIRHFPVWNAVYCDLSTPFIVP